MNNNRITASDLTTLLISKYSEKYVCVPECNIGSATMMRQHRIIDLWAMAKSWAKPKVIAFEIKVNRQDFLRDDKWPDYLPYCNEFYFVAPTGIIDRDEVPGDAGLLISSKNAKVLYTKKKAPFRDVKIPESIFRYVLMWRAKIVANANEPINSLSFWKNWLAEDDDKKKIGHQVSIKLRKLIDERIRVVEKENNRLMDINVGLQRVKKSLDALGIDESEIVRFTYRPPEQLLKRRINEINAGISTDVLNLFLDTSNKLKQAHDILTHKLLEGNNNG
uniref:Putative DNA repair protein n=1 Tax=viral metagenome TaxID=1070528 RepID=A0A6H1ZRF9_9ZZZZ